MPLHLPDSFDSRFLGDLADSLSRALADNGGDVIVHVATAPAGHDVGILALEDRSPADLLLGSVAPEHWWAMGVATRGSTRKLGRHRSVGPRSGYADAVVLVDRGGQVVSRVRTSGKLLTGPPASGATLDCLQRALGLPTAAPDEPPGLFLAQMWLDQVSAAPLTWRQVAQLHPACQLLATEDPRDYASPPVPAPASTDVVVAARALERVCDWDRLRWAVVEGWWPGTGLSGADAAWFDAGGFARWVLGCRPGLPTLLDRVCTLAGAAMARRCARALREMGLLEKDAWRPTAA